MDQITKIEYISTNLDRFSDAYIVITQKNKKFQIACKHPLVLQNFFKELLSEIFNDKFTKGGFEYFELRHSFNSFVRLALNLKDPSHPIFFLDSYKFHVYGGDLRKYQYLLDCINKIVTDMVREIENHNILTKMYFLLKNILYNILWIK